MKWGYGICLLLLVAGISGMSKAEDKERIVTVYLGDPGQKGIPLKIPAKFIGPDNLSLALKAKHGGQYKIIPLAFTYPDFQPWPEDWRDQEKAGNEELVYLNITHGTRIRKLAASIMGRPTCEAAKPSEKMEGFKICNRKYPPNTGGQIYEVVYHYRDPSKELQDILIICSVHETGKCRYMLNLDDRGFVGTQFSLDRARFSTWVKDLPRVRAFLKSFL